MIMSNRANPKAAARLLAAALVFISIGCTWHLPKVPIAGSIPTRVPNPEAQAMVGAARVDLTPIPGLAMNYSLDGKVSRGFWTRLYSRAIYLQDNNANALAMISVDLPHIPNGLHDKVSELVSHVTDIDHLGREQIILAATHTHNGPENYFSDGFYNGMVSARPGFDPTLLEFLALRIVDSIALARDARKSLESVKYRSAKLEKFFRNRSPEAFNRNGESRAMADDNKSSGMSENCILDPERRVNPTGADYAACLGVHARVDVVDFFVGVPVAGTLLTSMAFLAVHPTVLGPETEVFQADLFGVAAALLEQKRLGGCAGYEPEVVALFNGAQGDVSATWERRDRFELLNENVSNGRLGLAVQLAHFICGSNPGIDSQSEDYSMDLHFQFSRIELENQPHTPEPCVPWTEKCTVEEPLPGIPSLGGAEDGRTFWYEVGAQEGLVSASRGDHGRKAVGVQADGLQIPLAKIISNPDAVPDVVPIGVYRIGSLVFAALPGEFTTMLGERIREAVGNAVITPGDSSSIIEERVILIGLANGHVSYVTTPEEYDAQAYEGAQNLFGAATGPAITTRLEGLGDALNESSSKLPPRPFNYDPGPCHVFQPHDVGFPAFYADDGLQNIVLDLANPDATIRDPEPVCWVDAIPELPHPSNTCTRPVPYVWIEPQNTLNPALQCTTMFSSNFLDHPCDRPISSTWTECVAGSDPRACINGVPQDNCNLDLVTVLHGAYRDRTRWCSFWMPPATTNTSLFAVCAAGVTDENVIKKGRSVAGIPLDAGDSGLEGLLNRHLECQGIATRDVCEFPP
jgi:neutral ceramidase